MYAPSNMIKSTVCVASALLMCILPFRAQSIPTITITTQPAGQTNMAGTPVTFSVAVAGTGPFSYQWQFNGTNLANNLITTVAGNGAATFAGDGGPATNAALNAPIGVALDAGGNLYIADTVNNRIRRVGTNGIITTVAGTNAAGFSGDGGPATNANLNGPTGLALDAAGNLYIADYANNRIRKVAANGLITTVAGTNAAGFSGDGGPATNASLYFPSGVAVDATNNLYIADNANSRIRRMGTNGVINTVAGDNTYPTGDTGDGGPAVNASLYYPFAVTLDAAGDLYTTGFQRVRKVGLNGLITTVAGTNADGFAGDGGPATNALFDGPFGVACDARGKVYVADRSNNRIRMVDTNGLITTVAGDGPSPGNGGYSGDGGAATNAGLNLPYGLAVDAVGNLYLADAGNNRIREVHFAGLPTLTMSNLSLPNAGNYSVVISNPSGSVTSAVVPLVVTLPPPQIFAGGAQFGFLTNRFGFNLSSPTGQTVVVDGSTNLVTWTPLYTNTAGGNPIYFYDPASTNFPRRFYRARTP
jgi:sugar lactone lactonase YvrE